MKSAVEIVHEFWRLMATNDFFSVGVLLSEDFVLEWPQSGERILGAENLARMNTEYPKHGAWQFSVQRVVGNDVEAVSDVKVTDGSVSGRALTFFTVTDGLVTRIVEFWPEPFEPAPLRSHLVELNP
ncbi:MAG: nuclear transport factor 2 family protein [Fimbriimonadaceae bacterium]|nr:nuclear transport factor 2 family protein [Fimbriimonadaceae bacterium]QYK55996.1 MAG: nuclear transport factor 2 family protein [Fimbriimonadaceae bacterium]